MYEIELVRRSAVRLDQVSHGGLLLQQVDYLLRQMWGEGSCWIGRREYMQQAEKYEDRSHHATSFTVRNWFARSSTAAVAVKAIYFDVANRILQRTVQIAVRVAGLCLASWFGE